MKVIKNNLPLIENKLAAIVEEVSDDTDVKVVLCNLSLNYPETFRRNYFQKCVINHNFTVNLIISKLLPRYRFSRAQLFYYT